MIKYIIFSCLNIGRKKKVLKFKLLVKTMHRLYLCTICYQMKDVIKEMKLYGITDNLVFISYLKGRYGSKKLKTML